MKTTPFDPYRDFRRIDDQKLLTFGSKKGNMKRLLIILMLCFAFELMAQDQDIVKVETDFGSIGVIKMEKTGYYGFIVQPTVEPYLMFESVNLEKMKRALTRMVKMDEYESIDLDGVSILSQGDEEKIVIMVSGIGSFDVWRTDLRRLLKELD